MPTSSKSYQLPREYGELELRDSRMVVTKQSSKLDIHNQRMMILPDKLIRVYWSFVLLP